MGFVSSVYRIRGRKVYDVYVQDQRWKRAAAVQPTRWKRKRIKIESLEVFWNITGESLNWKANVTEDLESAILR